MRRAELDSRASARLYACNQRYTPARRALIGILADAGVPLTVTAIGEREQDLALSSTYRNLVLLEQAGLVRRVITSAEHASYELAEEFTEHHHHLLCTHCGSVVDFTISDQLENALAKALQRIARRNGFDASSHRLDLVGLCVSCQQERR